MNIEQWNLLSNLVHCFDEYNRFSFVKQFIQDQNALPVKLRFKCPLVKDFFTSTKTKIQLVSEKNPDLLLLSPHDRTSLLRTTIKHITSVSGMFVLRQHHLFEYPSFYNSAGLIFGSTAAAFTKYQSNPVYSGYLYRISMAICFIQIWSSSSCDAFFKSNKMSFLCE